MDLFLPFISTLGLVFAVGSSTYAITFFQQSILDGQIDETEKRFLHTVYFILRLGMVLLSISVLSRMILAIAHASIFSDQTLWFQFTLLIAININAILMDRHLIPMWLGPAIAGGSWYSYLFSVILAPLALTYALLMLYWGCLIVGFILLLRLLREYTKKESLSSKLDKKV